VIVGQGQPRHKVIGFVDAATYDASNKAKTGSAATRSLASWMPRPAGGLDYVASLLSRHKVIGFVDAATH